MIKRPNIIFIHTDQQRGDCLNIEGHPVLETPNMNELAFQGVRFSRFYSACPSCIAARRSILTGQYPQTFGLVGYKDGLEFDDPTLPSVLRDHGYQTYHVGRDMHQYPGRKRYGFEFSEVCSGWKNEAGEYEDFFNEHAPSGSQGFWGTGILQNDWTAAPWKLEDCLHPSNWTAARAINFFEKRDPTCPYFLSVGFVAPHPPLIPPAFYFERYLRTGVPKPVIGDWAEKPPPNPRDYLSSTKINFNHEQNLCARAGYYGLINHIDDLLRMILRTSARFDHDTIVILTSDHGEMLGDHYCWRKTLAFEPSARVPFIIKAPERFGLECGKVIGRPATHADIMPTILDMLEIDIPQTVDGLSLYPLMKGESVHSWRDNIHIEHAPMHQCVTDGHYKFIWRPKDGKEYFFDLHKDPQELHNAVDDNDCRATTDLWRNKLINRLLNRPEGFVNDNELVPGKNYEPCIPV